jgi:phosphoribosylanthranilate isomerase
MSKKVKMSLKIKVCGMRDIDNIQAVSALPIDYMGFIFYEKSPRYVSNFPSLQDLESFGFKAKKVGVFVNADLHFVVSKVLENQLDIAQLHGKETVEYISELKFMLPDLGFWKAFPVDENFDFKETEPYKNIADMFLFDTKSPQHGGAGIKFDWSILTKYHGEMPFMLAGGITENDVEAIKNLKSQNPKLFGLDLNSKFEMSPALKDVEKLTKFVASTLVEPI